MRHTRPGQYARHSVLPAEAEEEESTEDSILQKNGNNSIGDLKVEELELLHHYTTETCFTLSDRPESQRLWQKAVPQEAFSNQFLMRGILAISALHLSSVRPGKGEYFNIIAEKHQNLALGSFRNAISSISRENCNAFFALSSLVVVYAFASLHPSRGIATAGTEHIFPESLSLIRGVNSILQTVWPWILAGSLGGLVEDRLEARSCSELPEVMEIQLGQLYSLCGETSLDPDWEDALKHAIAELRSCYAKFYSKRASRCEVSIAFVWPVVLRPTFVASLQALKPEALVVLAFYCVVLHHLDEYWWMEGRGRYILNTICLSLDKEWLDWVRWPRAVVESGGKPLRLQNRHLDRRDVPPTFPSSAPDKTE